MYSIGMTKETRTCQRKQEVKRDLGKVGAGIQSGLVAPAHRGYVLTSRSEGRWSSPLWLHIFLSYRAFSLHPAPCASVICPLLTAQVHGWCGQPGEDGFLWEAAVANLPRKHLLKVQWDGHSSGRSHYSGYLRLQEMFSEIFCSPTRRVSFSQTLSL